MSNRNTESRRVSSAGTVQLPARPGGAQVAPPGGGGGDTPAASGSGKLPGVRGPGPQSFSAAQEFAADVSSASGTKKFVLPSGEVIDVPEGLSAKVDKRGNVVYRVEGREVVVRLVGELLFRVSRGYRGSVACLDDRRMSSLLGLSGYLDAFSSSWVRGVLVLLGFEEVRRGKSNKAIVIDMRKPIMSEIKNAKSINEVVEIIKRHLRW